MIENYMKSFGLSIIICALGWAKKSNLYSGNQPGEKFFITYLPAQSNVNRIYIFCLKKNKHLLQGFRKWRGWVGGGTCGESPHYPTTQKVFLSPHAPPLFCPQNDDFVIFMQFLSNMALSHKSTTTTSLMENPLLSTFNSGDPVVNSSWLFL